MKKIIFSGIFIVFFRIILHAEDLENWKSGDTITLNAVTVYQEKPLPDGSIQKIVFPTPTTSLDDINERIPTITTISRGAYAKEPGLMGLTGGQINVTIDGMKMFGACTDKMDPITSYVEPVNLAELNYPIGTNGAKNGSTVGGTYNMQLLNPVFDSFKAEGGASYNSVSNGLVSFLMMNLGREKWAYRFSGVVRDFHTYKDGNGELVPFTQYQKWNIQNSLIYRFSKANTLKLDVIVDDAYDIGYPALPMDVAKAQGRIYALTFNHPGAKRKFRYINAKVYANTVYHVMDDSQRDSLFLFENKISREIDSVYMRMDMPGWSRTYGAFAQGTLAFNDNQWLDVKAENYTNWSKAEMTMYMNNLSNPGEPPMFVETWPENVRTVSGLYAGYTHKLNKVSLNLSARGDLSISSLLSEQGRNQFAVLGYPIQESINQAVYTINAAARWDLDRHSSLYFTGGYGQRLPTLSEQFGFYLFSALDGYDYIGNPELEPEKALNYQFYYTFTRPGFKINWQNSAYIFTDYIFGVHKPDYGALNLYAAGVKQYQNLDHARSFSSSLQVLWKPNDRWDVVNLAQYNFGELDQKQAMPLVAPVKNILGLAYHFDHGFLQLENELSAAQNRINKDFGEVVSKGYSLFHIRGGWDKEIGKTTLQINASVENILNKAYSAHLDWGTYLRPGRNVQIGFTLKY